MRWLGGSIGAGGRAGSKKLKAHHEAIPGERQGDIAVTEVIRFLAAPFAASLILTGIHAYLGIHASNAA